MLSIHENNPDKLNFQVMDIRNSNMCGNVEYVNSKWLMNWPVSDSESQLWCCTSQSLINVLHSAELHDINTVDVFKS